MMKVVIMAGGKGTRTSKFYPDTPKPLIPIDGIPILEREIIQLANQGFKDFIFTVSYQYKKIKDYFSDGHKWGINIDYYIEDMPQGNAGALFFLDLKEDFLLINSDILFDIDFAKMINFHNKNNSIVTILTHPNSHPYDSGLIVAKDSIVTSWLAKEDKRPIYYKNRVNAGIHILSNEALNNINISKDDIKKGRIVDLDRDILKPLIVTNRVYCYDSPEYVKDMGTIERINIVESDLNKGVVQNRNLSNKQKAIFLDRDGTINENVGLLSNINNFRLIPKVSDAIKLINESEYLTIVVTNQSVIARGDVTYEELDAIHNKMETLLAEQGAYLNAIYYCPHHPDNGFEGEVKELKIYCECRKPKPGMLLKAAKDFNIDLEKSYMIGDSNSDLLAGKAAGCKSILTNGYDLYEIIKNIIN